MSQLDAEASPGAPDASLSPNPDLYFTQDSMLPRVLVKLEPTACSEVTLFPEIHWSSTSTYEFWSHFSEALELQKISLYQIRFDGTYWLRDFDFMAGLPSTRALFFHEGPLFADTSDLAVFVLVFETDGGPLCLYSDYVPFVGVHTGNPFDPERIAMIQEPILPPSRQSSLEDQAGIAGCSSSLQKPSTSSKPFALLLLALSVLLILQRKYFRALGQKCPS
jgi:hypothetical protein